MTDPESHGRHEQEYEPEGAERPRDQMTRGELDCCHHHFP